MPNVRNLPAKVGPYLLLLIPYIHSQIVSEDMLLSIYLSLCIAISHAARSVAARSVQL